VLLTISDPDRDEYEHNDDSAQYHDPHKEAARGVTTSGCTSTWTWWRTSPSMEDAEDEMITPTGSHAGSSCGAMGSRTPWERGAVAKDTTIAPTVNIVSAKT
jgi:hypothetical protein